ncbi:unnamed protein product [Discosporangium mesarthrocarpum]
MDAKLPLVLVGEPGIGKNALLSNWVKRRALTKHKDEFLFQFFTGASTQAKQLPHMLHKLETALKEFFQLREMEVPSSEERLIWSLNRFLAAAAKKYFPARIVIVVDGVFAIKGQDMPAGALHWLPTELPAGVRFIVSTVATTDKGGNLRPHRTYMELLRRSCPVLEMEPMNEECQRAIICAFSRMYPNDIQLSPRQISRVTHLEAQSKPMYLRTLMYALRLQVALEKMNKGNNSGSKKTGHYTDASAAAAASEGGGSISPVDNCSSDGVQVASLVDKLLDVYLTAEDSISLTSKVLDVCAAYVDEGEEGTQIMGAVLAVQYGSRNGMTDEEVWGAAEITLGYELSPEHKCVLLLLLKDNTMIVQGQRSFSHEEFRQVVYTKYIQSPENMVHLHMQMARYFARLPASDRKVDCQPYHLEAAGCWNKLKNCLVDIDMFGIWWTPAHKKEFVALWASLTNASNQDLASLGVPFLSIDEDGRSVLNKPQLTETREDDKPAGVDQPPKPNEDFPDCTTYFYHRWMWIQFPWVALANCGTKYVDGISLKGQADSMGAGKLAGQSPKKTRKGGRSMPGVLTESGASNTSGFGMPSRGVRRGGGGKAGQGGEGGAIALGDESGRGGGRSVRSGKLPGIGPSSSASPPKSLRRKRSQVLRKGNAEGGGAEEDQNYWVKMMTTIHEDIQEYRSQHDALALKRTQMERKLKMVTDELNQMIELAGAKQEGEEKVASILKREEKMIKQHNHARLLAKNYKSLLLMCERHPAHSQTNFSLYTDEGAACKRHKAKAMHGQQGVGGGDDSSAAGGSEGWEEAWAVIRASTGITDPDLFIQKHLNCDHLESQMMELKQARSISKSVSEARLSELKSEIVQLEEELEHTRYNSLSIGGNKEARDLHQRLNKAQARKSKERTEAVENLQRHTVSGLRHICDLLGAQEPEDDSHVAEMVRVAPHLVRRQNEEEVTTAFPEMELDSGNATEDEDSGCFVPNRAAVKAKSAKSFRAEQRRQARLQKTAMPM